MKRLKKLLAASAVAVIASATGAFAQGELRIGLGDDPGSLDPAMNASFVGRVSLQSVCDKLVDIDPKGTVIPMLAKSWTWSADGKGLTFLLREDVVFHDGEPLDAESVRYNLDRFLTLQGSRRRPELALIDKMEVKGKYEIHLALKQPSVSFLVNLTDRAGMMVSRKAVESMSPADFGAKPVCAGPYSVAEYKPQQTLTLTKFPRHWRAGEFHFDRLVFAAVPDSNIRLLNLRAGSLDLIEQVAPSSLPSIERDPTLKISVGEQPAFTAIFFNLTGPNANPDFAKHAAVREAFAMAIDRKALNDVVFGGRYFTGNQPFPPGSFWYNDEFPVKPRDVAGARAKLREVGLSSASLELLVSTNPEEQEVGQVLQAMAREAGINLTVKPMEFIAMRNQAAQGNFQAYMVPSAGRVDPDLNISLMIACGVANNVGKYCSSELDGLLAQARAIADPDRRRPLYKQAVAVLMRDLPILYLFNQRSAFAHKATVNGFTPYPDGIIRLQGVRRAG